VSDTVEACEIAIEDVVVAKIVGCSSRMEVGGGYEDSHACP